ncbi:MAG: hypothetical protein ABR563_08600 [Pyrinomonadaceae bacterium]
MDYDRAGNLTAVRRIDQAGDAALFLRASFSPFTPLGGAVMQGDPSCLFGGDGWFDGDTFNSDFGMGCDDPFGGFGGGFGDGGGLLLGDSPACADCKQRHKDICYNEWKAAYSRAVGVDVTATAGCAIITAGAAAIFCAIAAGAVGIVQVVALNADYDSCILKIPDTCVSYCPASPTT